MGTIGTSTNSCDKCCRSLDGKGWLEIAGMKICGICQYESSNALLIDNTKTFTFPLTTEDEQCNLYESSGTEDSCDCCGKTASEHFITQTQTIFTANERNT